MVLHVRPFAVGLAVAVQSEKPRNWRQPRALMGGVLLLSCGVPAFVGLLWLMWATDACTTCV